jgi:hypothetical protein
MTQNNKPEWFEITDADEKPALGKVSKSLPVSAVLVAALILGVGVVMAETPNQTSTTAIAASTQASPTVSSNPISQAIAAVKSVVTKPTTAAAVVVGGVATNKLANPAISKLPSGGGDDDEDDEDHDEDDEHDRDHDDDDEGDDD